MSQTETSPPPAPLTQSINFRVTIDTESASWPREESRDAAKPTSIDQELGHMVVTASRDTETQGSGNVVLEASAGDILRFFISSGSNNFEKTVWLVSIRPAGGDEILEELTCRIVERPCIAPNSQTEVLPAQVVPRQFRLCECIVAGEGSGSYDLVFALYGHDEEAQPRLISHYRWAMQLTITPSEKKETS